MGIWREHFHPSVWLRWDVLGWILATVLAVAGLLLFFDQYAGANVCFALTAFLVFAKVIHAGVATPDSAWHRLLFTFVLFGLIGIGIVETMRGVNNWAAKKGKPAPSKESAIVPAPSAATAITPDNAEQVIGEWLNRLAVTTETRQEAPTYFTYFVRLQNGNIVILRRYREGEGQRYITFQSAVVLTPQQTKKLNRLSAKKAQQIADRVQFEVAKMRIGYRLVGPPLKAVEFSKAVPIDGNLSRDSLSGYLDEFDSAIVGCLQFIKLQLGT